MRARRIIEGATFGPEVVRTAIEAFEAAWSEIGDRFEASSHEAARELLATSIISAVRENSADPDLLRRAGLRAMARAYPETFASPLPGTKPNAQAAKPGKPSR